ncbi:MAG: prepilin-type N-terminal cleavage/methylation domain-containing protein [Oligoflexus sp.]|nr:prepilin-type N-terminal cleavage/methylation domain-containing protein [Oligoflexus sp.]
MLKPQKKSNPCDPEAGFSLVEIIFALAIFCVVILATFMQSSNDQELSTRTNDKLNRSEIERIVRQNLDCNDTTETAKIHHEVDCQSTSESSQKPCRSSGPVTITCIRFE